MSAPHLEPVKVLVVDDSAVVRSLLTRALSADPDIEVIGSAADPYAARDIIVETTPDVLTLDIEMPRMDGVSFLRKLMAQYPIPTVMVSSLTTSGAEKTFEALSAGAVDFIAKPSIGGPAALGVLAEELRQKVKAAARVDVSRLHGVRGPPPSHAAIDNRAGIEVIAMGASTGGVEALSQVIGQLGPGTPPVLIAQHMPREFTHILARRLQDRCHLVVQEASEGQALVTGQVYVAPGDRHLTVAPRRGRSLTAQVLEGPLTSGHRPSVDVLFRSVAERVGRDAIGVLLTGMGADGAEGLLAMREAGAKTLAQDEQTSVVFGMPRRAIELGAALEVSPLGEVSARLRRWMRGGG